MILPLRIMMASHIQMFVFSSIFVAFFSVVLTNVVITRLNYNCSDVHKRGHQKWQLRMADAQALSTIQLNSDTSNGAEPCLYLVWQMVVYWSSYLWSKNFLDTNHNFKPYSFISIAGNVVKNCSSVFCCSAHGAI